MTDNPMNEADNDRAFASHRATAAEPEVSALRDGIANAPKSMADVIPQWGEFLDGLAKACEEANPEAWKNLVEACEKHPTAQAIEARRAETQSGSVHESAVHAPKTPQEET